MMLKLVYLYHDSTIIYRYKIAKYFRKSFLPEQIEAGVLKELH